MIPLLEPATRELLGRAPSEVAPQTDEEERVGEALRSAAACRRLSASDGEDWRDRRAQGGSKLQHSEGA